MNRLSSLAVLLSFLALGCDPAANSNSHGQPLAKVSGQLTAGESPPTDPSALRVSLNWIDFGGFKDPVAIIPHELQMEGSFPSDYSFDIYEPPPESVMESIPLSSLCPAGDPNTNVRLAFGAVAFYVDLNGNGVLDSIPQGGTPIDLVAGASFYASSFKTADDRQHYLPNLQQKLVIYSPDVVAGSCIPQGFSLLSLGGRNFDSDLSSLDVELSATGRANVVVCAEAYGVSIPQYPCGIWSGPNGLWVDTSVQTQNGALTSFQTRIYDGAALITDASVDLSGEALTPVSGSFVRLSGGPPLMVAGMNQILHATLGDSRTLTQTIAYLPRVTLVNPNNGVFPFNGSGDIAWTSAGSSVQYSLSAYSDTDYYLAFSENQLLTSGKVLPTALGEMTLELGMFTRYVTAPSSFVQFESSEFFTLNVE